MARSHLQRAAFRASAPVAPGNPGNAPNKHRRGRTLHLRLTLPTKWLKYKRVRLAFALVTVLVVASQVIPIIQVYLTQHTYAISGSAASLLPRANAVLANKLVQDTKGQVFNFNAGFMPRQTGNILGQSGGPQITAQLHINASQGITVTDPANRVNFSIKPSFSVQPGQQQQNRVVYPLTNNSGWLVYTLEGTQLKEDILLKYASGDSMSWQYNLGMADGLEARLQSDGSVGIFGSSLPIDGQVSTGSAQDAVLLQKVREKSPKNNLLFTVPAPVAYGYNQTKSPVQVHYELKGNTLKVMATHLNQASYPVAIDPSIYVQSAAQFMQGNNESNIDFDTTDDLIQKGVLTGGRYNNWNVETTTVLNAARWGGATVLAGGYIYVIGGSTGTTNFGTVYWAKLDPSNFDLDSPDPGTGACTNWCTNSAYNLPSSQVRRYLSAIAYDGYLYAIGGKDAGCAGTNNACSTVYYTRLAANGEPISWSTTSSLGTARFNFGAVAYQNHIYVAGGQTNTSLNGDQSVEAASVNPDGTLTAWTTTGMTAIPTAGRWGHTLLQYNGYIYLVGGASTTTLQNSVQYIKINSDSTLASSWVTTTSFDTARGTLGGTFAAIWGGFMYIDGGCVTVTTSDCTSFTTYSTGTASQATTTITGSGTTWTSAMVGRVITFNNGTKVTVARFTDSTHLVGNVSQTVSSQTYTMDLGNSSAQLASINGDGTVSDWTQFNVSAGTFYSAGTASQSTTAVTGSGTTWQTSGVLPGMAIVYANGATATITSVNSDTSLTVVASQTESSQAYTISNPYTHMFGGAFVAWRNTLYTIGGCSATTSSGNCSATNAAQNISYFGQVNTDGDISPAQTESTLPTMGTDVNSTVGRATQGLVVNGGYLYSIGGCGDTTFTSGGCTFMNPRTTSAPINADGSLGSWTVDNTHLLDVFYSTGTASQTTTTITGVGTTWTAAMVGLTFQFADGTAVPITGRTNNTTLTTSTSQTKGSQNYAIYSGLGAFGSTVYNGTAYAVGGSDGSGVWQSKVYHSVLGTGGTLGAWTTDSAVLPSAYGYQFVFARAASATTGNLYAIGGCNNTGAGIGCGTYFTNVLKCTITNSTGVVSGCATTNQLQIQDLDASSASAGLGIMGGAIYGDYIYLAGGACGSSTTSGTTAATQGCDGVSTSNVNTSETNKVLFAKINSSNNIVRADNGNATGGWQISANMLPRVRRRDVAYAVNGYLYVTAGHDGTTGSTATLSDIVYAKIDQTTGDIGAFSTLVTTITPRWNLGAVSANGYIYLIGGCTTGDPPGSCSAMSGASESVQVYNNYSGSPASYSNNGGTDFATDRLGAGSAILNGHIYISGGCKTSGDCPNTTNETDYGTINADGSISSWNVVSATGGGMPASRAFGQLETVGGTLYFMGGQDDTGTISNAVYWANPAAGGDITTWTVNGSTGRLPAVRSLFSATVWNNRIYVIGGTSGTIQSTIYYSPNLSAGGAIGSAWSTTTSTFTTARTGASVAAYGGTLYVMGGFDGTNYLLDTQYAPITSSGDITATWSNGISLPMPVNQGSGFAANGYLYVFGGRSAATTCSNSAYVAPIIGYPPGSSNRYGIGIWSQTSVTFSSSRYGAAGTYYNGKAYLLGGFCNGSYTGTNRVEYASLLAQPQISSYSLAINADSDVTPLKWLMNGVDNGIGAPWIFSYQSSTSANDSWGLVTNYGNVTLGTPAAYVPIDGSGTNTNVARYYYLYVTVDASQAFGYPEDVTRGPTITDLTLEFTSDPSKRLMHGRTFIGGQQQPEDTPF